MKIFLAHIISLLFLVSCTRNAKVYFDIPTQIPIAAQNEMKQICDKGLALWQLNCAKCHNQKVGAKLYVPDFTQMQLAGYELRTGNKEHETNLSQSQISADELNNIITFLTYKKKSGIPFEIKQNSK